MSAQQRHWVIILACAVAALIIMLFVGIGRIIEFAFWTALWGILLGAVIAAIDGAVAVLLMRRQRGYWIYQSSATVRFASAAGLAFLVFLNALSGHNILAALVIGVLMVPSLLIGFLLGSRLFTNRASIAQVAAQAREGNVDWRSSAASAASALREDARTGIGEARSGTDRLREHIHRQ